MNSQVKYLCCFLIIMLSRNWIQNMLASLKVMKAWVLDWCLCSCSCMCDSQEHVNMCWTSWSVRCHTAGRREALRYTWLSTLVCFSSNLAVFAHKPCIPCVWSQMLGVCVALEIMSCHGHPRQLQDLQCSHQTHSSPSVSHWSCRVWCWGVGVFIALCPPPFTGPPTGVSVLIPVRMKQSMELRSSKVSGISSLSG